MMDNPNGGKNVDKLTVEETMAAIKTLTREDQVLLGEMLRNHLSRSVAREISPGDAVKFTGRNGLEIRGTLLRFTGKNAKIAAKHDRYGPTQHTINWTVSRQLVVPA